jgi:hypothetical protein
MSDLRAGWRPESLPDLPPDHPLAAEWKTYRREAGRLLAEGHEGRYVLAKGNRVLSVWDTWRDAVQAGRERFGLETFLVYPLQSVELPIDVQEHYARVCRTPPRAWPGGNLIDLRPGIAPKDLPDAPPDSPLAAEWKTYKREAARLVAEGHEGRHALIKGDEIVGLFDTHDEAIAAGYERFGPGGFAVQTIRSVERPLRIPHFYC